MIVEAGGEFPKSVETLRKVRGIGDYTAGAIASIAFEKVSILELSEQSLLLVVWGDL